jgi:hypothetical protein
MRDQLLLQYLNILIELKIYPFAPLEINFIINLFWMLVRGFFKSKSEYRYSQGLSGFFQFKMINFMLSFLVMFLIFISLEFWLTFTDFNYGLLVLTPALASIILQEFSILLTALFYKEDENLSFEEKQIIKSEKELSTYFAVSFLILAGFWGYILIDRFNPSLPLNIQGWL